MTSRFAGLGVVVAALAAGLAFAPVFAASALVLPLVAALVPVAAVDLAALRWPRLSIVRAPLGLVAGAAVGLSVLTLPDGPWSAAARPVIDGTLHGWRHTLESTFPARPDAALLAFVPTLALLAAVIGVEWLRRGFAPLVTLLPSLAVVALAEIFRAATGWTAVALALGYGAAAAVVLAAGRRAAGVRRLPGRGLADAVVLVLPVVAVAGLGAWVLGTADPLRLPAYSVHDRFELTAVPAGAVSPLAEIGGRLKHPDQIVFTAHTDAPVDRWPELVLDGYDGAGWTSSATYRPLGAALDPDPDVKVAKGSYTAAITLAEAATGPWLPTQFRTQAVDGLRPAVDPATGTLLAADHGPATYTLRWQAPQPTKDDLVAAPVDQATAGAVAVADLPAGIVAASREALQDAPPSFAAALKLESWLKGHENIASGDELPTGSGNAQVLDFLTRSHRGTSEQFAAAYVLMARAAGIPARLVVGFRQPKPDASGAYVVRGGDAFVWPEVAVTGVGWVPLDPTGGARENPDNSPPTTKATDAARQQEQQGTLPVPQPVPPPPAPAPPAPAAHGSWWTGAAVLAGACVALLVGWLVGVPLAKGLRRWRRRRALGAQAVVGAWLDTRDRLRDHGVPAGPGMTVRDVRGPAAAVLNGSAAQLEALAAAVDVALWSGAPAEEAASTAWTAAAAIRRDLRRRPIGERARAALRVRLREGRR